MYVYIYIYIHTTTATTTTTTNNNNNKIIIIQIIGFTLETLSRIRVMPQAMRGPYRRPTFLL